MMSKVAVLVTTVLVSTANAEQREVTLSGNYEPAIVRYLQGSDNASNESNDTLEFPTPAPPTPSLPTPAPPTDTCEICGGGCINGGVCEELPASVQCSKGSEYCPLIVEFAVCAGAGRPVSELEADKSFMGIMRGIGAQLLLGSKNLTDGVTVGLENLCNMGGQRRLAAKTAKLRGLQESFDFTAEYAAELTEEQLATIADVRVTHVDAALQIFEEAFAGTNYTVEVSRESLSLLLTSMDDSIATSLSKSRMINFAAPTPEPTNATPTSAPTPAPQDESDYAFGPSSAVATMIAIVASLVASAC